MRRRQISWISRVGLYPMHLRTIAQKHLLPRITEISSLIIAVNEKVPWSRSRAVQGMSTTNSLAAQLLNIILTLYCGSSSYDCKCLVGLELGINVRYQQILFWLKLLQMMSDEVWCYFSLEAKVAIVSILSIRAVMKVPYDKLCIKILCSSKTEVLKILSELLYLSKVTEKLLMMLNSWRLALLDSKISLLYSLIAWTKLHSMHLLLH